MHKPQSQRIVIDAKVIGQITAREVGQITNYLKVTGLHTGYILNFKRRKLDGKDSTGESIGVHQCASVVQTKVEARKPRKHDRF